jgi:hypothetical protein
VAEAGESRAFRKDSGVSSALENSGVEPLLHSRSFKTWDRCNFGGALMNGLEVGVVVGNREKEACKPSETSDCPEKREPTLSDFLGVVERDFTFLLLLGGGGNPAGNSEPPEENGVYND